MAHEDFTLRFMTRRNALLFMLSFFIVIGFGVASRAAVFAAEFIAILMIIQYFTSSNILPQITVKRSHSPRTFEGEEITVDVEAQNHSTREAHLLEIIDSFPPSGEYFISSMAVELPAGSALPFRYRQRCNRRRGLYIIGPIKLRLHDSLGLYTFRSTLDELTRLIIYPQAVPIRTFGVLGRGTHFEIGEEIARRVGRSAEFSRLRQYRAGDPPRLIHWRSTARTGRKMIKEFEQSVVTEVTIYCDLFLLALAGIGDLTSVEYRIKAAASIATETIRRHHLVKVVALKNPREETRMGGGTQHLTSVLDWLALLKPAGHGSFEQALIQDAQLLRRGSTCILVMSTVHLDVTELLQAIALFQLRSIHVIAVLVEDRSFLKLRREQEDLFRDAPSLDLLTKILKTQGCSVFLMHNQQDVAEQLGVPA